MEDGIFPSYMTLMSGDDSEIEEERRLCYVGITRAKKELYLSAAKRRMLRGQTQFNKVSQFIGEIPRALLHINHGLMRGVSGVTSTYRREGIHGSSSFENSYMQKNPFMKTNPYKKQEFV